MRNLVWCYKRNGVPKYFLVSPVVCDGCEEECSAGCPVFHLSDWNVSSKTLVFCHKCMTKGKQPLGPIPPNWFVQEWRSGFVIESSEGLPDGAFPLQNKFHGLSEGKISTIDAALPNAKTLGDSSSVRVVDRTKLSGRPNATLSPDMQIGAPDMELLEQKDKDVPLEEVDDFLQGLASADHILPESAEKKELEDKRGEY